MSQENLNMLDDAESESIFNSLQDVVNAEDGDDETDELEHFLTENKLNDHLSLFRDQQIDFETLMILTETDLKSLGLPLGPFRKLLNALQKRKSEHGDESFVKTEVKSDKKDDTDLSITAEEDGNFRVVDESGDESDGHSVKSEGDKKKEQKEAIPSDKYHPYQYDLKHFKLADGFKIKAEVTEPPVTVDDKTFMHISDAKRLKSAIRSLRQESVLAVECKYTNSYDKVLSIMQISSPTTDYIIDFSKSKNLIVLLTDVFINPKILKVFYDAKLHVKFLQKYFSLFTINVYCVRTAVIELKFDTTSLEGLVRKYTSYVKLTDVEISRRNLTPARTLNLRKETHYLLHAYYQTRNEAIDRGLFDKIASDGIGLCGVLQQPPEERKPSNLFPDYDKFNAAQKMAAAEVNAWRESYAREHNIDPNLVLSLKDMKQLCMCLPPNSKEYLAICDNAHARNGMAKLIGKLKFARQKYFKDPNDETKYRLQTVDLKKKKPPVSPNKSAIVNKPPATSAPAFNKRKLDTSPHSSNPKKPKFRGKFPPPKRNSMDGANKGKDVKNFRGGFTGSNNRSNFQGKHLNQPSVWATPQNQNTNSGSAYGGGFKYY